LYLGEERALFRKENQLQGTAPLVTWIVVNEWCSLQPETASGLTRVSSYEIELKPELLLAIWYLNSALYRGPVTPFS
jgi:hypothetical protein